MRARHNPLPLLLAVLVVALALLIVPSGATGDVVIQAGRAFAGGLPVNVVVGGDIRLGGSTAIAPPNPRYTFFGTYTSAPMRAAHPFQALRMDVQATVPADGQVVGALRTARLAGPWSAWRDVEASTHLLALEAPAERWQYRLSLSATTTQGSPRVRQVAVTTMPTPRGTALSAPVERPAVSYVVFATREGLVGRTTANGHRIRPQDHFVALPSDTVLACDGCRDYSVTVRYRGRAVTQPVWDIGPWNTADNYWDVARATSADLPHGLPQARAAYQNGYDEGHSTGGNPVTNPAGIDLADGVFWDDLRLRTNDWVTVTYNWTGSGSATTGTRPYAAVWLSNLYDGRSVTAITLRAGLRSDLLTLWFQNLGTAHWDAHVFLAVYDPRHPAAPAPSPYCNLVAPDGTPDWASCAPGLPAFVGNGRPAGPGRSVPFVFYLRAPITACDPIPGMEGRGAARLEQTVATLCSLTAPPAARDETVYLRLAQQVGDRYRWIDGPDGQVSADAIAVHVRPAQLSMDLAR